MATPHAQRSSTTSADAIFLLRRHADQAYAGTPAAAFALVRRLPARRGLAVQPRSRVVERAFASPVRAAAAAAAVALIRRLARAL